MPSKNSNKEIRDYVILRSLRYRIFLTVIALAGWALLAYDIQLSSIVLPVVASSLNFAVFEIGLYGFLIYASQAIMTFLVSPLSDYLGRKRLFQWSLIITALTTGMTGLANSFASFAVIRMLATGMGEVEQTVGPAITIEEYPAKTRGRWYGWVQGGFPLGAFLASAVSGILLPIVGWRGVFIAGIIPMILVIIARRWISEPERFERVRQIRKALRQGQIQYAQQLQEKYKINAEELKKVTWHQIISDIRFRRTALASMIAYFINSINWPVIDGFVTYWLVNFKGWPESEAIKLTLIGSAVIYFGYVSAGFLGDIIGRREVIAIGGIISALGVYLMTVSNSFWPMTIAWILAFYGNGACMAGAGFGYWAEVAPTRVRSTFIGMVYASGMLGAMLGTFLFGILYTAVGGALTWIYLGSIPGILWTVTILFAKRVKPGTPLEEISQ
ncbi:hypothetical protein BFU36_07365 [Sulfolobus sp. A20]|uniref:MFS transporter n=1 Tax=Saccharolobus sp. A20 TaxID=1891280 RepID=UPI000845EDD9|nr:MFS transporter [Sulfolobus sp. A20]TRM74095.1 MFS transporter [Sulfolobus sp. A20-N-F8]TRM75050.1 MFS transporter [Sulfolobus sp. E5]TRM80683.1 MFS transporter [Sulfolobus sp. D5]TRM83061.1 MFS transporter [Sulfolobus sp. A20-N-F6]TRM85520.1 MFS transporter [Sulfolobus sp. F3]TRM93771.1 MFS transporter [Sulfolobus sp. A20-N-G8]TRN01097.1 MFS transporter [Sulfolobus sp. E1]